jgi:sarcosine oxidase subunit alpha
MSGSRLSAPHGLWIDRDKPVRFDFNGRTIQGLAGDTVASALLANGVQLVGRSYKLHRPRGIFSCGVEEPTGLLDIGSGSRRLPNTRATDILATDGLVATSGNCWPSLEFDAGSLISRFSSFMPVGFYYKTFMWPNWRLYEPAIRHMAAAARAGDGPDPDRYDEISVNTEVLVVGAGAAGLRAAASASRAGRKVLLIESERANGGWLATQQSVSAGASNETLRQLRQELDTCGATQKLNCTAFGLYDHNLVTAIERIDSPGDGLRERLWTIRAKQIILATGAFERPMVFPDNDRPGVMLAGAVERYVSHFGVACAKTVVVATSCDSGYATAQALKAAGIGVAAIIDCRDGSQTAAVKTDIPVHRGASVVGVAGKTGVQGVQWAPNIGAKLASIEADLIAVCGGFTPNVNLYSQAGGSLRWLAESSMFVTDQQIPAIAVVGAAAGVFDFDSAMSHADGVGAMPPGALMPSAPVGGLGHVPADNQPTAAALQALGRKPGKQFIDLQNDVASADIELAARENYRSVEHLKRYTTTGMATDQGKTSNINALVLLGKATQRTPDQVGTTKFRPPYKPVTLNAITAGRSGARYRPLKLLPGRHWHLGHGALMEEFGGWERPAAYPVAGEDLMAAAQREAAQVRRSVGLFEGSPLGKIEIYGPDAASFLDLMYVGTMSTLPIGCARYGAMCNENGIVIDDGIVARLGPNHFLINTTSGGVDRAVLAFEEWLQCEFVDLRVLIVPVTSQWGNVTVSGPSAWTLLQRINIDASLAPGLMKHMTIKDTEWQGKQLRVMRASFNGELGYEINLPPSQVQPLLDLLWLAGNELGVCAYGVEALMLMRTEKGFLHVGADTDGTTLPGDVGLARGLAKKVANFVGRRSLLRPASFDPDRLQLVGLQPVDRQTRLPVGAHLSISPPPADAEGFVTSSCYSPALRQPIALALVKRGMKRIGEQLTAWHLGSPIPVEIVLTPFYDPSGERLNG